MTPVDTPAEPPLDRAARRAWYHGIGRAQWNAVLAANLGWLFDGYETYALIVTIGVALHQLLAPGQYRLIPAYAGAVLAITLFGWGLGGMIGGILADYIGRKRMMILAIIAYSVTTGLSALSWSWLSFAVLRFIVGLAIGSEWATGTSITAELWPDGSRGKGAGLMQCGLGIGFFVASLVWLVIAPFGPSAWRYMFLIGVLPALVTLWIRRGIPESALWERARDERRALVAAGAQNTRTRFTLAALFDDPRARRRTLVALAMSLTTTLAWWGISSWVPPYIGSVAAHSGHRAAAWAGLAGMTYNVGAIAGYIGYGFLADAYGRRRMAILFFAASLVLTPVLFLWTHSLGLLLVVAAINGFFTLGQYSWMSTWLPELYPTHMRATAVAFVFNAPRFIACLGPFVAGTLIVRLGGYGPAATIVGVIYVLGLVTAPFLPETRGEALPAE